MILTGSIMTDLVLCLQSETLPPFMVSMVAHHSFAAGVSWLYALGMSMNNAFIFSSMSAAYA